MLFLLKPVSCIQFNVTICGCKFEGPYKGKVPKRNLLLYFFYFCGTGKPIGK